VLNLRGGNLPEFIKKHKSWVSRLLESANRVISPSAYLQQSLKRLCEEINVIPNPIDLEDYPFRLRETANPRLVWVRAFHEIYNPSLAPELVSKLIENWPSIHLTMVGPDKGDGSMQRMLKLAKSLDILDRIRVIGGIPRSEVPRHLHEGDIFINTTNFDNTPVSVIEAMACGLCIVSTNVGGIPWLLDDEINALLVPPDDPIAMAEAVERVLTNPALAVKLSANSRKKAESYDWSIILPQWESVFKSLVQ
jgi:glycosyltransferase involved in cell wall biosynthesis